MKFMGLILTAMLTFSPPAHADQDVTGFRVGGCISLVLVDCAIIGLQAEYALERFTVGASLSPLGWIMNGRAYLPIELGRLRPFVGGSGGNTFLEGSAGSAPLEVGAGVGADLPWRKLILRGQLQVASLSSPLVQTGGDLLYQF